MERPISRVSIVSKQTPTTICQMPARKKTRRSVVPRSQSASRQIDAIIKRAGDWRGATLSHLRALIKRADAFVVEEVKWKKPSNPMGVPVWSRDGILCIGDTLKSAVRLTFPKGAQMKDPKRLFNTRLDSATVRAVDFREGDPVDGSALIGLILEAVEVNAAKKRNSLRSSQ